MSEEDKRDAERWRYLLRKSISHAGTFACGKQGLTGCVDAGIAKDKNAKPSME